MPRRKSLYPLPQVEYKPIRRPGNGWNPRYLIQTTRESVRKELEDAAEMCRSLGLRCR